MKSLLLLPLLLLPLAAFATGPHSPPETPDVFDSQIVGDYLQDLSETELPVVDVRDATETISVDVEFVAVLVVAPDIRCRAVSRSPYNPVTDYIRSNTGRTIMVRHTHPPDFDGFRMWSFPATHGDRTALTEPAFIDF